MNPAVNFSIFPLGDSAITIDLGNHIDKQLNTRALALHDWLQAHRFPGLADIIIAYSSVSAFYNPDIVRLGRTDCQEGAFYCLKKWLEQAWEATEALIAEKEGSAGAATPDTHFFRIPVCYGEEHGPDLEWVAREKGLTQNEVIRLHSFRTYHIYMIGFLPGFPYLGKTDPRLEVPRKAQPVPVMAGAVGIAGVQTGVYSLNSPGGWQIIGRTPITLFNPGTDPPVRLQAGDQVQFYPISREEFSEWKDS